MEWKRSFAVAVAVPLPYLFDGSERLLHNNSLQARKPKAETGASAKIEPGKRGLTSLGRGASKELGRRDSIALSQTGISSRPPPPPPQYYIVPLSSPAHRWPPPPRPPPPPPPSPPPPLNGEGDMTDSKTLYALLCYRASVALCCGLATLTGSGLQQGIHICAAVRVRPSSFYACFNRHR